MLVDSDRSKDKCTGTGPVFAVPPWTEKGPVFAGPVCIPTTQGVRVSTEWVGSGCKEVGVFTSDRGATIVLIFICNLAL